MPIPDSKREQNHLHKEAHPLFQIGMTPISPIGFQCLSSDPRILPVMRKIGSIVILGIIFFQHLRLRLRINKDETAFLALNHLEPAGDSI